MMGQGSEHRWWQGTLTVFCICLLGFGIMYVGGRPVYEWWKAEYLQSIVDGTPSFKVHARGDEGQTAEEPYVEPVSYGTLACEEIGLDVPLYFGDGEDNLLYGAGIYPGGSVPGRKGTTLVSAHDSTYFKSLESIQTGDLLEIRTQSARYGYRVREVKVQKAKDGFSFSGGEREELVLYTCYPFGEYDSKRERRFFVYCDLVE